MLTYVMSCFKFYPLASNYGKTRNPLFGIFAVIQILEFKILLEIKVLNSSIKSRLVTRATCPFQPLLLHDKKMLHVSFFARKLQPFETKAKKVDNM